MKDKWQINNEEALRKVVVTSKKQSENITGRLYEYLTEFAQEFLAESPMVFVGTANRSGHVDVSPKGDAPGFIEILDNKTLLLPERVGNKDARGLRNLLQNNHISLLCVIPRVKETLRITGTATITKDPELLERLSSLGRPAELCINIHVKESFFHCGRSFNRAHLWNPEKWPKDVVPYHFKQTAKRKNKSVDEIFEANKNALKELGESDGAF